MTGLADELDKHSHDADVKASDYLDESDYERGRYFKGMRDAFAYAAAKVRPLSDRLAATRDAHDWGCDCTSDDPCRVLIALNDGPETPDGPVMLDHCRECHPELHRAQCSGGGCVARESRCRCGHGRDSHDRGPCGKCSCNWWGAR